MRPGSNPPVGPPPTGRGPAGTSRTPARRIEPRARWYALPVLLVLVAVTGFLTVFALLRDDSRIADGPSANGDPVAGVRIRLAGGHGYFLYVRTGRSSPFACSVEVGNLTGPIHLTRQNAWNAAERASYRYTATFEAPVSGSALLRCRGTEGPILVTPDDTARAYLGAALFAAMGLGALAAVSFVVTLVRRGAARRGAASPAGPSGR